MAVNKTFEIALDMKRATSVQTEFTVVEGDNGNILQITLTDDGVPVDLTGCRVLAVFGRPDGTTVEQDTDGNGITIGGDDDNVITIELYTGSFAPAKSGTGQMHCELQVYSGDDLDVLVTSAQFTFKCRRSTMNDDTILATNEYPILVGLIASLTNIARGVQADWSEDDDTEAAYIKNKPTIPSTPGEVGAAAALHAARHASNGADPVTPASIGAMAANATPTPAAHAASHASNGADPVTAAAIGAVPASEKGAASGVATLNSDSKVTASQASATLGSEISSAATLALADAGKFFQVNSESAVTITIPLNETVAFPTGTEIEFCRLNTGTVTFAVASGGTLLSVDSVITIGNRYGCAVLKKIATDTWLLAGDLG